MEAEAFLNRVAVKSEARHFVERRNPCAGLGREDGVRIIEVAARDGTHKVIADGFAELRAADDFRGIELL